jgi:hypothetical protein
MRWAQRQRLALIAARLESPGFVNRRDLMSVFGISLPQASTDLQAFLRLNPASMSYNSSSKRYESTKSCLINSEVASAASAP